MSNAPIETLLERFRDKGDLAALTRLFDEVAPELLPLALRLSRARHDAEDLVQETFLVALEKCAEYDATRPLRPWLVGILVREARRVRRAAARVIEPERLPRTPAPEPPESAEEAELRAAVASALGDLPPKYSEVVSLHLFEGLAPKEMSARLGIDAELVRTHLSRGLERLRRSLPASAGAAWSVADLGELLPRMRDRVIDAAKSLPIHVATAGSGVLTLAVGLAAGLVAVAALTAGVLTLVRGTSTSTTTAEALAVETSPAPSQPVASENVLEVAPSTTREPAGEAQTKPAQSLTIVRGRVLMPDGSGARGATVSLEGWPANDELVLKYGVPKDWKNPPDVETNGNGEFQFAVDPPRAFQWIARAKQKGFVNAGWRWSGWMRGTEKQLGKVLFQPGCAVAGTLTRADGQPLGAGWSVGASPAEFSEAPEALDVFGYGKVDPRDGSFRIDGLAPGSTTVDARHEVGPHGCETVVTLAPGKETTLDLIWTGPDPTHTVCVRATSSWRTGTAMQGVHARLVGADGRELRPSEPLPRFSGPIAFENVPHGDWRLEFEAPSYAKVTRDAIHPGQAVHVELQGDASIRLSVSDPDGKPIEHYDARLALQAGGNLRPSRIAGIEEASPAVREIPGVPSLFPFQVEVTADGFGTALAKHEPLAAGESRSIRVTLERGRDLEVLALDSDGKTPLAGLTVELTRGMVGGHALGDDTRMRINGADIPPRDFTARTGSDGRAQFAGIAADTWTARVDWSPWFWTDAQVDLRATQAGACKVAMPEHGFMHGKVLLAEQAKLGEALVLVSVEAGRLRGDGLGIPLPWSSVGSDGSYRLGPFAPGNVSFVLMRAPVPETGSRKPVDLARVVIEAGKDTEADIDLRQQCTAHLQLDVRLAGKVLPRPDVSVILVDLPGQRGLSDSVLGDVDGTVSVPLAPGERQLVAVRGSEGWLYRLPEVFRPGQCETLRRSIDIPMLKGSVLVLDGNSHEPVRNHPVTWSVEVHQLSADPAVTGMCVMSTDGSGTTNSEGKLELTLPPCDLSFELREPGAARAFSRDPKHWGEPLGPFTRLRWTDKGPAETTITLPPR